MAESQIVRQTKTHYTEDQEATTKLVQRMTNVALNTPNLKLVGIQCLVCIYNYITV